MFHHLRNFRSKIREFESDLLSGIPIVGDIVEARHEIEEQVEDMVYPAATTASNLLDSASPTNCLVRALAPELRELYIGDHLYVQRPGFTHHGILIDNTDVVEYDGGCIVKVDIEEFSRGVQVRKRSSLDSPANFSANEIVTRAKSRIGESAYDIIFNNCEHFVRWCRAGA